RLHPLLRISFHASWTHRQGRESQTISAAIPLGIEAVALEPALDLLAHAPELGRDLGDVALVLLEERVELIATGIGRGSGGSAEACARDVIGQVLQRDLADAGELGGALDRTHELAGVARPGIREQ